MVETGHSGTCGLRADGSATCWGWEVDEAGLYAAPDPFAMISRGYYHTCGIRLDGTLKCWGVTWDDEPPGKFIAVSSASDFSCAVRDDGRVLCWNGDPFGAAEVPPI